MKNNRILILLPNFQYGGGEKISLNLAQEFKKNQIEVTFISQFIEGEFTEEIKKNYFIIKLSKSYFISFLKLLYFLFVKKYDALISNYFPLNTIASLAGFISFTKVLCLEHSPPTLTPFINNKKYKFFTLLFYNLAHKIICVSEGIKNDIINNTYVFKNKLLTIYNPIPDHGYRITNNRSEKFKIISVGRLKYQKNHFLLIDAIKLLNENIKKNISVSIIGDGELKEKLENYIKKNNLNNIIKILGFKNNPMKYVAKSNLFILSSDYEGLPTVLIEASYTGIDIISTDCPYGPSEILKNYSNSTLVSVKNRNMLCSSIEKYYNKKINKSLKRKNIDQSYLPNTIFKKYYSVIYKNE